MVFEKVAEIIANELSVAKEEITSETRLREDLGADSLNAIEVIMALEDEFNISIADDQVQSFKTVQDIVDYIQANK